MTNKSFIFYNDNGDIIGQGNENEVFVQKRIDDGEKVIMTDGSISPSGYKVNMNTMEIIPKNSDDPPVQVVSHIIM